MGNPIRYNYPGAIYHVIPRSNNEENIFPDSECCRYYLGKLKDYCKKFHFSTHCYCIMITHPHLLLEQLADVAISEIMHAVNTGYAMYFNKRFNRHGRLFCCKYKSLLIDNDSYFLEVSRYIHNNPVRAKIVKRPQDYPWSSYKCYTGLERSHFVKTDKILDILEPLKERQFEAYRRFVISSPDHIMLTSPHEQG